MWHLNKAGESKQLWDASPWIVNNQIENTYSTLLKEPVNKHNQAEKEHFQLGTGTLPHNKIKAWVGSQILQLKRLLLRSTPEAFLPPRSWAVSQKRGSGRLMGAERKQILVKGVYDKNMWGNMRMALQQLHCRQTHHIWPVKWSWVLKLIIPKKAFYTSQHPAKYYIKS